MRWLYSHTTLIPMQNYKYRYGNQNIDRKEFRTRMIFLILLKVLLLQPSSTPGYHNNITICQTRFLVQIPLWAPARTEMDYYYCSYILQYV